jgi:hypothetical protein
MLNRQPQLTFAVVTYIAPQDLLRFNAIRKTIDRLTRDSPIAITEGPCYQVWIRRALLSFRSDGKRDLRRDERSGRAIQGELLHLAGHDQEIETPAREQPAVEGLLVLLPHRRRPGIVRGERPRRSIWGQRLIGYAGHLSVRFYTAGWCDGENTGDNEDEQREASSAPVAQ